MWGGVATPQQEGNGEVLAKACGVDEKQFVRMIMHEYHPDIWRVIQDSLEFEMLSDEERRIIEEHRARVESVPDEGDESTVEA